MTGMLAASKAGHDRDKVYVIIEEDDEYVYLADGRGRTADRPKKKNKRHIQIIKKIQMEKPQGGYRDLEIKRTIPCFRLNWRMGMWYWRI